MHKEFRIPLVDRIAFVSKRKQEIEFGCGKYSVVLGRWFAVLEGPNTFYKAIPK